MLRVFSFSLTEEEKDWYHTLLPGSASTWLELKKLFLNKFFPATALSMLKKQICNIEQSEEESLYDYYERFKKLLANCPYHGYAQHDLMMYLHDGLRADDRRMVNSACGGNFLKKTYEEALDIIATLAEDSRLYSNSGKHNVSNANYVDKEDYELLKEEVRRLRLKSVVMKAEVCGICHEEHSTNSCPTMVEDVRMASRFQPPPPVPAPSNPIDDLLKMLLQNSIQSNTHLNQLSQAILQHREVTNTRFQKLEQQVGHLTENIQYVCSLSLCHEKEDKHAIEKGEPSKIPHQEVGARLNPSGARRPSEANLEEEDSEESALAETISAPADREQTTDRHPPQRK